MFKVRTSWTCWALLWVAGVLCLAILPGRAVAQDPTVAPLMRLLQSGKLPPERLGTVAEMVCKRGADADLRTVYDLVLKPENAGTPLQKLLLNGLADAAVNRKVKPTGDLAGVADLVQPKQPLEVQLAAIRLGSLWQVAGIAPALEKILLNPQADRDLQAAAIEGLVRIQGKESLKTVVALTDAAHPQWLRYEAVAALASFDLATAATRAAAVLPAATANDDPAPLMLAFLNRQGGADVLAAALGKVKLSTDAAKIALRYMYSVGRSDAALSQVLSTAAGVASDPPPPTKEEVQKLVAEVQAKGDAARGELIFRRAELSCTKCHAVARAGGDIGPDLSPVGATYPMEYLVSSILNPNEVIKEAFLTRIVITSDGATFQGIVVDRTADQLVLKDATGKTAKVPVADIEEEVEGKSLMPSGLTKFLTREELLDLVKFLAQLGKPGDYAIRSVPTIQRWRVLQKPGPDLLSQVPNVEIFREQVLAVPAGNWTSVYGKTGGKLPLADAVAVARNPVVYLQGEVNVTVEGEVTFEFDDPTGLDVWVDAEPFAGAAKINARFAEGKHTLTLRVDTRVRKTPDVMVTVQREAGTITQFEVVGGP